MGVLLVGMLFAGVAGAVVGLSLAWIAARRGMSNLARVAGICVGILVALLLVGPSVQWVMSETTTTHLGINADQAEQLAASIGLQPNTFGDFCYHESLAKGWTIADFSMDESEFVRWMRSRANFDSGTYTKSIDASNNMVVAIVRPVRSLALPNGSLNIMRGHNWFWINPNCGDNSVSLAYDLDSGRAYYEETTR